MTANLPRDILDRITGMAGAVKDLQGHLSATIAVLGTPTAGQVATATSATSAAWQTPSTAPAALLAGLALSASKPATGTLTLSTSDQDVAGCSLTFTLAGAHGFAHVTGAFDFQPTSSSAGVNAVGKLLADASTQTEQAIWTDNGASSRETVSQSWVVPLGAGSHTLKLRASKTSALGTHVANTSHTNMTVLIFDLP